MMLPPSRPQCSGVREALAEAGYLVLYNGLKNNYTLTGNGIKHVFEAETMSHALLAAAEYVRGLIDKEKEKPAATKYGTIQLAPKKRVRYMVVSEYKKADFQKSVEDALSDGWSLHGGLVVAFNLHANTLYSQALTKEEEVPA